MKKNIAKVKKTGFARLTKSQRSEIARQGGKASAAKRKKTVLAATVATKKVAKKAVKKTVKKTTKK